MSAGRRELSRGWAMGTFIIQMQLRHMLCQEVLERKLLQVSGSIGAIVSRAGAQKADTKQECVSMSPRIGEWSHAVDTHDDRAFCSERVW